MYERVFVYIFIYDFFNLYTDLWLQKKNTIGLGNEGVIYYLFSWLRGT